MTTIPASTIANVTPNVIGASGSALDLIGLVLTSGTRVPVGTVASFPTDAAVAAYFGEASVESAVADIYFGGFTGANVVPGSVLFAQYPTASVSAFLRGGNSSAFTLAGVQALSGSLSVTVDGRLRSAAAINLSSATSFSSAAALVQTGLNAAPATLASFTGSIAASTLTVSALASGTLGVGATVINGTGITAGTIILSQISGTAGGTGTYSVTNTQTFLSGALTTQPTPVVVTFDSVSGDFVVASGATGVTSTITFATGTLAAPLFLTFVTGAVTSQGSAAATPTAFMGSITNVTQNWATFMLAFDPDSGVGNAQKLLFVQWANGQSNRYAYIAGDTDASPGASVPASASLGQLILQSAYSGTCLIYDPSIYTIPSFVCGAAASVNFSQPGGRITFDFKGQVGIVPSVTDPTTAANLIANGYNFYGAYATANQTFQFFNPGSVSGPFAWLDSFLNQVWLNAQFQLALVELLTQVTSIPYNPAGYTTVENALASAIQAALDFGAFRPGVTLSSLEVLEVNTQAGAKIDGTLLQRGWYLQVKDPGAAVRQVRGSPVCNFWYMDGESIQKISLASILVP